MRSKSRRWVGVDGEGVGRKPHRYVLLACSDGDYIEDRRGLSTADCLNFLLDLGTRDVRVCGYYLSYDWTKIFADLDDKALYALFRPEMRAKSNGAFARVDYRHFQIHWLGGAVWLSDGKRRVTVWDLGKYSQGAFVTALKEWNIRPEVQAQIEAMKKRRSRFTFKEISRIRSYCFDECEALAELATAIEQAHIDADLKPRGWFGPGSTASVLLRRHEIHEKRGHIPPILLDPIARAFFGGRSEVSRSGYIEGPISSNDISSAYPYHASQLPCLEHGRWERVASERALTRKGVAHALIYGHIRNAPGAWAPLPVRLENGSIVFPTSGASGWWWRDEWLTARRGWKGLEFDHAYVLRCQCDCKPFAFMPEIFEKRLAIGKETGAGKILKLGMNSVYGKLAQTIGGAQYASRAWAGMITSGTRAQVLDLMLRHKRLDNVLMIATDGLFSTEQHDADKVTDLSGKVYGNAVLGGWEREDHGSMTIIKAGMYWLGDSKLRARGIGRDSLNAAKAILGGALVGGSEEVELAGRVVFGGAKSCVLASSNGVDVWRRDQYGQWFTMPTHVSLRPGPKRAADWSPPTLQEVESAAYGVKMIAASKEAWEFTALLRELTD
jgi:hypothetical protein